MEKILGNEFYSSSSDDQTNQDSEKSKKDGQIA